MPAATAIDHQQRIDQLLARLFPEERDDSGLSPVLRYAALAAGKRLRPRLVYAAATALEVEHESVDHAALAVELIHCYSLIHDDLPAMDDDDLRRGQPTVHKAFDEALAILAGDKLQTMAFDLLVSQTGVDEAMKIRALKLLTRAASDMVDGQVLDIAYEGAQPRQAEIERMLSLKTGALIKASVLLPSAYLHAIDEWRCKALADFAEAIGLAFQIRDDVLDIIGDTGALGKPSGSDAGLDKASWPARIGMDAAHARVGQLYERAIIALENFGARADGLRELAENMVMRQS